MVLTSVPKPTLPAPADFRSGFGTDSYFRNCGFFLHITISSLCTASPCGWHSKQGRPCAMVVHFILLSTVHLVSPLWRLVQLYPILLLANRFVVCLFHKIYYFNPILCRKLTTSLTYASSRIDHRQEVNIPSS